MSKQWTLKDGKTRHAGKGPTIAVEDMSDFIEFARTHGHETRTHTGLYSEGYQIRKDGHWMGLLWNKWYKRYTADRRLSALVEMFNKENDKDGTK